MTRFTDMTPLELKQARRELGLSASALARAVGVASERTVRRWEAGSRAIPGPVARLLALWRAHPELLPERSAPVFGGPLTHGGDSVIVPSADHPNFWDNTCLLHRNCETMEGW